MKQAAPSIELMTREHVYLGGGPEQHCPSPADIAPPADTLDSPATATDVTERTFATAEGPVRLKPVEHKAVKDMSARRSGIGRRTAIKVLATFAGIVGAGEALPAINPERAGVAESLVGLVSTDTAEASWTALGEDPLVPGGVHSNGAFVKLMLSDKGTTAMKYAGLNKKERASVKHEVRTGDYKDCDLKYGMHFDRMSFGRRGTTVERDVTFLDTDFKDVPADATCIKAPVKDKNGKTYYVNILVPDDCANFAVVNRTHVQTPHGKPPVKAGKIFEDVNGNRLPFLPGVARVEWQCGPDGKFRRVLINSPTQNLGRCAVGKRIIIREADTLGGDGKSQPLAVGDSVPAGAHWRVVTPQSMQRTQTRKGVTVRFKNQQLPKAPVEMPCPPGTVGTKQPDCTVPPNPVCTPPNPNCTPPPANLPPRGDMAPPDHLSPQGIGKICVDHLSDPEGQPVTAFNFRVYKADDPAKAGVGRFLGPVETQPGGAQCIPYEAPPNSSNTQQTLTADAQVTDGKNTTPVAPKNFFLLAPDFGPVGPVFNS